MQQIIRSELPVELQEPLANSRFVLLREVRWKIPEILAHGDDPVAVSRNCLEVKYPELTAEQKEELLHLLEGGTTKEQALHVMGVEPLPPHRWNYSSEQVDYFDGTLYRIDEAKRS